MTSPPDGEFKWRGVPISELSDHELQSVHKRTCEILRAIGEEMQRRGLWKLRPGSQRGN